MRLNRLRIRERDIQWRDALVIGVPLAALVIGAFWLTAQFIQPAPPRTLIIGTGAEGGAYQRFGALYQPILKRYGIELKERKSAGALENLKNLLDPASGVEVAFMQGGLGVDLEPGRLVALGSIYYEPVWVFYRDAKDQDRISALRGKRIAVGAPGSGTRRLALDLLEANGIDDSAARVSPLGGLAAAEAMQRSALDAVILVGPAQSAAVWTLLYMPGVKLMSLAHAEAYVRRFPWLARLTLPQGGIDLVRDIPGHDVSLLAPVAALVARDSLHPALVDLLLETAREVHGGSGLFQKSGEFPAATRVDLPLSDEAERYYKSGTRFLQRYLPFWAATFLERMIVLLIPVFAILIPLVRIAPAVYGWRVRSRIYRWYGELKFLEQDLDENPQQRTRQEWLERVDRIEHRVHQIPTPNAFANHLYLLRDHVELVRARVLVKTAPPEDGTLAR